MKNTEYESIFVVDYDTGFSVVHEYMTSSDFNLLQQMETSGYVRIMNHVDLGIQMQA